MKSMGSVYTYQDREFPSSGPFLCSITTPGSVPSLLGYPREPLTPSHTPTRVQDLLDWQAIHAITMAEGTAMTRWTEHWLNMYDYTPATSQAFSLESDTSPGEGTWRFANNIQPRSPGPALESAHKSAGGAGATCCDHLRLR